MLSSNEGDVKVIFKRTLTCRRGIVDNIFMIIEEVEWLVIVKPPTRPEINCWFCVYVTS